MLESDDSSVRLESETSESVFYVQTFYNALKERARGIC